MLPPEADASCKEWAWPAHGIPSSLPNCWGWLAPTCSLLPLKWCESTVSNFHQGSFKYCLSHHISKEALRWPSIKSGKGSKTCYLHSPGFADFFWCSSSLSPLVSHPFHVSLFSSLIYHSLSVDSDSAFPGYFNMPLSWLYFLFPSQLPLSKSYEYLLLWFLHLFVQWGCPSSPGLLIPLWKSSYYVLFV